MIYIQSEVSSKANRHADFLPPGDILKLTQRPHTLLTAATQAPEEPTSEAVTRLHMGSTMLGLRAGLSLHHSPNAHRQQWLRTSQVPPGRLPHLPECITLQKDLTKEGPYKKDLLQDATQHAQHTVSIYLAVSSSIPRIHWEGWGTPRKPDHSRVRKKKQK